MLKLTNFYIPCDDGKNRFLFLFDNFGEIDYVLADTIELALGYYCEQYGFSDDDIEDLVISIISVKQGQDTPSNVEGSQFTTDLYELCSGCEIYPCIVASNNW